MARCGRARSGTVRLGKGVNGASYHLVLLVYKEGHGTAWYGRVGLGSVG